MSTAITVRTKNSSSIVNSSPIVNRIEPYSPSSSSTTLSPESSNSISSPDKSFLSNEQQQQHSVNLVDYFVVCGLDKDIDVEPSTDLLLNEQILNPFQCSYRCRVLSHYPNEVPNNSFDEDAISRLSMPNGVSIKQNSPDPPTTHPFLITRLDGTRYYGVALTFYEQLNNHEDGVYSDSSSSSSSISSKAINSLNCLIENYNQTSRNPRRSSLSSVVYASKAICLIGPQSHYSTFKRILELLYQMTIEHDLLGLPFEAHLYNILHELNIPSPLISHSVLKLNVGERQLTVWQPCVNDDDLPLLDFNLLEFFSLLGVQGVVDLVTCALLEHQIILKSSDYTRLMLVAECLTSLLFPFQWTLLYVPIVFTAALVCLDVPVPAIMGLRINKSMGNDDNDSNDDDDGYSDTSDEATFEVQRCVVHIDKREIQLPDDMPRFPDRSSFIDELKEILSRFENDLINTDLSKNYSPYKRRNQGSEDWTHVEDNQTSNELTDEPSQALARLSAIAKRAGILLNNNNNNNPEDENSNKKSFCLFNEFEMRQISANCCLRASFVNRFAQLFCQMDAFICYPPSGKYSNVDQWLAQRSTTKNFDRTMFIADQPKPHVPFLLAFMETQSFVSFVDTKIAAKFNEDNHFFDISHKYLQYFTDRMRLYRTRRDLTYQKCPSIDSIDEEIRRRFTSPISPSLTVLNAPLVRPLNDSISPSINNNRNYLFENLNGSLLESLSINVSSPLSSGITKGNARRTRSFQTKHPARRVTRLKKQQTVSTNEQQHVPLVESEVVFQQLLKECTTKTKRMVIEKMEGILEGSTPLKNLDSSSMVNLEENVLIAGFCDLLERIWSHGLHNKPTGKSALWNHIKCYIKLNSYESAQVSHVGLPITLRRDENPALVWCLGRKQLVNRSVSASRSESPSNHRSHTLPRSLMGGQHQPRSSPLLAMTSSTLNLLPSDKTIKDNSPSIISLIHDYHSIESCFGRNPVSVSASEIGFARAFVRLALERRLLSRHLSELFSHSDLLQALYKRDAFLRAEDGDFRKQFLAHVESLQLLDYKCFSNSYPDIDIEYHVTIVPTKARTTGIGSTTTANPYIALAGLLGSTKVMAMPSKTMVDLKFQHKNLGQLTTLRIGHDNSGLMPRWNIDYVNVQNKLTNFTYRFPCGRWLGKGVDDDSLERLLFVDVAASFEMNDINNNYPMESGSPSQLMTTSMIGGGSQSNLSLSGRSRSPSLRRANDHKSQTNQQADDIYELLGRSINQLVKYFDEPEKKRGLITPILCGEDGLVNALEKTLSFGLKKTTGTVAFFGGGRKRYVWDFLIKVCDEYDGRRSQWQKTKMEKATICYINGVRSIEKALSTFGKDGRFQSWCCLACKLHLLSDWFRLLSQCSDTCLQQFYDPLNNCFRQEKLNQFIVNILEPVRDFDFAHLEPALLKGLAGV